MLEAGGHGKATAPKRPHGVDGGSRKPPGEAADAAPPATKVEEAELGPFARVLRGLGTEVDRGERLVRRATGAGGQDLGPAELLALQAGVYRYSEAVDLSAKLIDRATNGVKTILQGQ